MHWTLDKFTIFWFTTMHFLTHPWVTAERTLEGETGEILFQTACGGLQPTIAKALPQHKYYQQHPPKITPRSLLPGSAAKSFPLFHCLLLLPSWMSRNREQKAAVWKSTGNLWKSMTFYTELIFWNAYISSQPAQGAQCLQETQTQCAQLTMKICFHTCSSIEFDTYF